jgi:hypothetical protein
VPVKRKNKSITLHQQQQQFAAAMRDICSLPLTGGLPEEVKGRTGTNNIYSC